MHWKPSKIHKDTPNEVFKNGGDRVPVGHLLSQNEASGTRIGLHPIELYGNC